jgi:hypothetical protein
MKLFWHSYLITRLVNHALKLCTETSLNEPTVEMTPKLHPKLRVTWSNEARDSMVLISFITDFRCFG